MTRDPLDQRQLMPNLAIKEAVQAYLDKHGWAYSMKWGSLVLFITSGMQFSSIHVSLILKPCFLSIWAILSHCWSALPSSIVNFHCCWLSFFVQFCSETSLVQSLIDKHVLIEREGADSWKYKYLLSVFISPESMESTFLLFAPLCKNQCMFSSCSSWFFGATFR